MLNKCPNKLVLIRRHSEQPRGNCSL